MLLVTLLFGAIGWVDDYRKVIEKNSRGREPLEVLLAVGVWPGRGDLPLYDYRQPGGNHPYPADAQGHSIPLGAGFIVLTYFVIVDQQRRQP